MSVDTETNNAPPSSGDCPIVRRDFVAGAAISTASFLGGGACQKGPPRPAFKLYRTDDGVMPPVGGRLGGWSLFTRDLRRIEHVTRTVAKPAERDGCEGFRETHLPDGLEDKSRFLVKKRLG